MLPNPGRGSAETSVGCRKSPREHKGCTRVVQGMYKGYPREQHHDNTVAIPEQYRVRTLLHTAHHARTKAVLPKKSDARPSSAARTQRLDFRGRPSIDSCAWTKCPITRSEERHE